MAKWLILYYRPTTLFTLKMTHATSSGGKTLLVPSPYSFKMALVDAAIRAGNIDSGKQVFEWVKDKTILFSPPKRAVVTNTFIKVLRKREIKNVDKNPVIAEQQRKFLASNPFQSTIVYREFCYYHGDLSVAIDVELLSGEAEEKIKVAGAHINYLGKRGSFVQYLNWEVKESLPGLYTLPANALPEGPALFGMGHFLDDLGSFDAKDLFDRVNTYSDKKLELNKHRVLVHHLLPYRQGKSSRGYTEYIRCDLVKGE